MTSLVSLSSSLSQLPVSILIVVFFMYFFSVVASSNFGLLLFLCELIVLMLCNLAHEPLQKQTELVLQQKAHMIPSGFCVLCQFLHWGKVRLVEPTRSRCVVSYVERSC